MKNNTIRNLETLTYAELKNLVPETPKGKMPTPKKLETEEVLFTERIDGADITVLKNGYVIYTVTDDNGKLHRTVYSVHRCSRIVFPVNFSKEERDDAWDCKFTFSIILSFTVSCHARNQLAGHLRSLNLRIYRLTSCPPLCCKAGTDTKYQSELDIFGECRFAAP